MIKRVYKILIRFAVFAAFVCIASVSFLYAKGIRFNTDDREFVATGVLDVGSVPDEAAIFLDDKYHGYTDQSLDGMQIKEVNVRIEKGGYITWQKSVKIDEQMVIRIEPLLVPKDISASIEKLGDLGNVNIDPYNRGLYIVYPNLDTIRVIDFISEEEKWMGLTEDVGSIYSRPESLNEGSNKTPEDEKSPQALNEDNSKVSEDEKSLLVFYDKSVWVLDVKSNKVILVGDFDTNIEDVFWVPESTSIIVVTTKWIKVVDIDGDNEVNIFQKDSMTPVFFLGETGSIIWQHGGLWLRCQIVNKVNNILE